MWFLEWPKKEGWYWIYRKPRGADYYVLEPCRVYRVTSSFAYVAGSLFLYPEEQEEVYWLELEPPKELPIDGDK